jgi:hypothetical protein
MSIYIKNPDDVIINKKKIIECIGILTDPIRLADAGQKTSKLNIVFVKPSMTLSKAILLIIPNISIQDGFITPLRVTERATTSVKPDPEPTPPETIKQVSKWNRTIYCFDCFVNTEVSAAQCNNKLCHDRSEFETDCVLYPGLGKFFERFKSMKRMRF